MGTTAYTPFGAPIVAPARCPFPTASGPDLPAVGTDVALWWYGRERRATVRSVGRTRITVGFVRHPWHQEETLKTVPYVPVAPRAVPRGTAAFAFPAMEPPR